jgi:hypothetical protein
MAMLTMHELRQDGILCDVTLCVEGRKFPAHKIVLAGSSPYLKAMFTNGMLETDQDVVEIRDIEASTMQNLLDFMYTSTVEITVNNVQSILQGASLFGLQQLRVLSAQFLQLQLTANNCLGICLLIPLLKRAFFCTGREAALLLIFWGKLYGIFARGKKT